MPALGTEELALGSSCGRSWEIQTWSLKIFLLWGNKHEGIYSETFWVEVHFFVLRMVVGIEEKCQKERQDIQIKKQAKHEKKKEGLCLWGMGRWAKWESEHLYLSRRLILVLCLCLGNTRRQQDTRIQSFPRKATSTINKLEYVGNTNPQHNDTSYSSNASCTQSTCDKVIVEDIYLSLFTDPYNFLKKWMP